MKKKNCKILYIEDDLAVATLAKKMLETHGYEVTIAETGQKGLEVLQDTRFDLLLLDNILPDISGLEILQLMKEAQDTCPVIFITASGNEEIAVKAFRLGAADYIIKNPSFSSILPFVVEKTLKNRKAVEARAKADDFVMKLINTAPDPLFVKDEDHNWILLNDAFCEFIGYSREELIGKTDYDFFPKEEADVFWEKDDEVFRTGIMNENIEEFTDATGKTRVIATKKTVFTHSFNGQKILVGLIRDITPRVKLEKKINRIRRENSAFMRHELKNLLSPVMAYSDLLLKAYGDTLSEKQQHYCNAISNASMRIAHLIDALKQLEDFEFGQKKLNTKKKNLLDVIENAVANNQFISESANVEIEIQNRAEQTYCMIDEDLLPGVFINLIKNAIEHVGPLEDQSQKKVIIDISNSDHEIAVGINNRGEPIPPESLSLFFEKFNSNRLVKKGGTGLGTTYALLITKAHGGKVTVASDAEYGTTVTVYLNAVS